MNLPPAAAQWLEWIVLGSAVAVFIGAVVFRWYQRGRTALYYRQALADPDAVRRAMAAQQWAKFGLYRSAGDLLRALREDPDPIVRSAIVTAVRARAWEPSSSRMIRELRAACATHDGAVISGPSDCEPVEVRNRPRRRSTPPSA